MSAARRLTTAVALAVLGAGLAAPDGQAADSDGGSSLARATDAAVAIAAAPSAVVPVVARYPVRGVDPRGVALLGKPAAPSGLAALSRAEPASGFAVTGVTWRGAAPPGLALAVRTQADGRWSPWTPMVLDTDHGPTPGSAEAARAVPGTDPFVVGDVDNVQLKATSDTGAAPDGLTLSVIDPGTAAADAPSVVRQRPIPSTAAPTPVTDPVAVPAATPMPVIYSRADWGADESLRDCCVEYGEVHAGFVHHTVNSNDYTRAEVPAILRGIYAYHTQSRGWRDIGYNYLIDRFGRIWEGRYGGVTLPVVGAHTLNYNENSFAASAIGNFETAQPTSRMLDAYARLYAWKLSLHGVRPTTKQDVAGTVFNAISGHRDAAQTACPGIHLYAKIPQIIDRAMAYQHLYLGRDLQHSFVRDPVPDVLAVGRADGGLGIARGTGAPGFEPRLLADDDLGGYDEVTAVGDVTGDDVNDLIARDSATGVAEVLSGTGAGTFTSPKRASQRWADSDLFAGPGDLDGDGHADVVARDLDSGDLLFYPGRATAGFGAESVAVTPFTGADLVTGAGDFDGDGHADLLARGGSGGLWLYRGDGTGAFPAKVRLPGDWSGKDVIAGGADLTGDGRPDVVARSAELRQTRIFANVDGSRLSPPIALLRTPMAAATLSRDLTGDARPDLAVVTPGGGLALVPARRQNWLTPPRARAATWDGVNRVLVVGDWDGDGYADAMARSAKGQRMWLYPGRAGGGLGEPEGGWPGWGARRLITPVGDFDGDGRPDLMARSSDGRIWLYPGRGDAGFKKPVIMRSGLPGVMALAPVGRWNADGAPDVVAVTAGGQLMLYPGNGPGGLDDPVTVGKGFDRYDTVVGVGDLTGDGRADLVGRTPGGDLWLIAGVAPTEGRPYGGFAPKQYLGSGWSGLRLG